jgi:predicted RNase H-like nuclease
MRLNLSELGRTIRRIIVGIDSATEPAKVGLACVALGLQSARLEKAELGKSEAGLLQTLAQWLRDCDQALIAIDAPLGWPSRLGTVLSRHRAGEPLADDAHQLFRRDTDRFIKLRTGKQSLDVGADRIARTAFAAIALLNRLRKELSDNIPLAWQPSALPRWCAIEVYPAATLRGHRIPDKGYKAPEGLQPRTQILRRAGRHIDLETASALLERNVDALDAVLCTLAGFDFISGTAMKPDDREIAEQEGWIWARDPQMTCQCESVA